MVDTWDAVSRQELAEIVAEPESSKSRSETEFEEEVEERARDQISHDGCFRLSSPFLPLLFTPTSQSSTPPSPPPSLTTKNPSLRSL